VDQNTRGITKSRDSAIRSTGEYNYDVRAGCALVGCLWLLAGCGGATHDQSSAARKAAVAYVEGGKNGCCVHGLRVTSASAEVSTADPAWAAVFIRAEDAHGNAIQSATVVLHRARSTWRVVDIGSALLGCGVPAAARKDLGLDVPATGCP